MMQSAMPALLTDFVCMRVTDMCINTTTCRFEKQIQRSNALMKANAGGVLVITEGVFGMAGDQGKLKKSQH